MEVYHIDMLDGKVYTQGKKVSFHSIGKIRKASISYHQYTKKYGTHRGVSHIFQFKKYATVFPPPLPLAVATAHSRSD